MAEGARQIEAFWEEFDEEMDIERTLVDNTAFSLFGNDNGGGARNEYGNFWALLLILAVFRTNFSLFG